MVSLKSVGEFRKEKPAAQIPFPFTVCICPVLLSIISYAADELASDRESRMVLTKSLSAKIDSQDVTDEPSMPTILRGDSRSFYAQIFMYLSSYMTCNFVLKLNNYIF